MNNKNKLAISQPKAKPVKDKKISIDMMHYKNNRTSFWLILLTIALNIAMFIIIYKANTSVLAADLQLGFDLIINVIFMLACFLAAEKTKRYSKEWAITSIVLGGIEVARIFWIPLYYYLNKGINAGEFSACVILLAIAGASLIFAGIITLIKYNILQAHKPLIDNKAPNTDDKPKAPTTTKKPIFKNIVCEKITSIDNNYNEYLITFDYKGYTIPYYMFFNKNESVSLKTVKTNFNKEIKSGKIKRYALSIMFFHRSVMRRNETRGE